MRKHLLIAAAAAGLAAAAPAHAADPAQLSCVLDHLDLGARGVIAAKAEKIMKGTSDDSDSSATGQVMTGPAASCRTQYGWSQDATTEAISYAVATISLPIAERVVREHGINLAKVKALYASLPVAAHEQILGDAPLDPGLDAKLTQGLAAAGVPTDEVVTVGRYWGFLVLVDVMRERFAKA